MRRLTVPVLCLVQFVDVLGVTSATTAIPAILAGVGAPGSAAALVATAYAMFFGGLLVLGARLGDRYGHRRVLLVGIIAFTVVSVVGATSTGVVQVVAARGLQGAAAAVSVPSALSLLLQATPDGARRRTALAAWSAAGAAAGAAGFVVGGLLAQTLSWRWVFWVNAPVGVLLAVGVLVAVAHVSTPRTHDPLDVPGALLLIAAVMGVVVGSSWVQEASSRWVGVLTVLGGIGLGLGFVLHQRRASAPLIPPSAFGSAHLRRGTVVSFVNTATTSSPAVLATLLLQDRLGVSPIGSGLLLISLSLAVIPGSVASRPLIARWSAARVAAIGLFGIALGNLLLVLTAGTRWGIVVGSLALGLGLGVASVAGTDLGTSVTTELTGSATGILNTGAQLGTALGVAAMVAVASSAGVGPLSPTASAWLLTGVLAAGTAVAALRWSGPADRLSAG